jgi:hypothetical protein
LHGVDDEKVKPVQEILLVFEVKVLMNSFEGHVVGSK